MQKNDFNQTGTEKAIVLICPHCHKSTTECSLFYRHMFDQNVFGYFLKCSNCLKRSFLQVIYPVSMRNPMPLGGG